MNKSEEIPPGHKFAFADVFQSSGDLRFHFILPIPIQNLEEQTLLLGFTPDVMDLIQSLKSILLLPQHPYEIAESKETVIAVRMMGSTFQIRPLPMIGLPLIYFDSRTPLICFVTNKKTSKEINDYRRTIDFPTLHISTETTSGSILPSDLKLEHLLSLFQSVLRHHETKGHADVVDKLKNIAIGQRNWKAQHLHLPKVRHLSVLPN